MVNVGYNSSEDFNTFQSNNSSTKFEPKLQETRWSISHEKEIWKLWQEKNIYKFDPNAEKIFSIDTPPPYPSGKPWHVGAASHYSQIDMIARAARMLGYSVYFPIGMDRNGIGVERYAEKRFNISLHKMPREEFLKYCKQALDELEAEMLEIMKSLGLSGDFDNYYQTDSEEYRKLTQATFIELWNRGLIYFDTRPNNYCPVCKTTIADAEVVYEEVPTKLVYIKFRTSDNEEIVIATTRPELLCSCQAVLINAEDERYKHLVGKKAIVPIYGREVPILAHPIVKSEFGSGIEMVCSYGDYNDVMLFRELGLKEIIAIDEDGRMTNAAGKYAGLKVEEAREKIIEDLKQAGLIVKIEQIMHRTPTCERSHNPIEIIPMQEIYLKQLEFKDEMLKIANELEFLPEFHRQLLINWINSITKDWPISRRRYYATEIPIWYCKKCGKPHVPKPGKYYRPWKEKAPFEKCEACGSTEFIGETRTFDTWFDSSITPLFISRFMKDEEFFKKVFPATIRPQGKDIVRTWLYYTLLRCYQLTGKRAFQKAWITGYCVDEKGEKMSKSKGNVIDPVPLIQKYGADAFRFWGASESSLGFDFRASEKRVENASKFITKLWNIARYVSQFPLVEDFDESKLLPSDKWILSELKKTYDKCLDGYKSFNFFIPATEVREFLWNLFANHYIEMSKKRAYGEGFNEEEQKAAWYTLHKVMKIVLKLLAPIIPFITEYIWLKMYGTKSIHLQVFDERIEIEDLSSYTEKLIEFNSLVWKEKKRKGLSLKDPIKISIPEEIRMFEKELKAMHNIEE
ncbi:MAG: valine--tRNA ligase [Candidatus Aenigmarchaeota archaeon]|nr:valine--tRNA ligase [Candidatus Aenigmarchaeota archaeon]